MEVSHSRCYEKKDLEYLLQTSQLACFAELTQSIKNTFVSIGRWFYDGKKLGHTAATKQRRKGRDRDLEPVCVA